MIKSMTGYGSAEGSCGALEISLELKSVNNRYLDCSVRLPRSFLFAEEAIKSEVQRRISRGKVDVFVNVVSSGAEDMAVAVNGALAKGYADAVARIAETLGLENGLTARDIARFPDVLSVERKELDKDETLRALAEICAEALEKFDGMRRAEGERLRQDIAGRLDTIELLVAEVERRSPETVAEYRARLQKKLSEILQSKSIDEQRILTEAAIFADKVAVDEETVRLRSHVSQLRGMLDAGSPIGRKMDFLVQEFNREANTIGSKCSDSSIAKTVIELKSEIEKIREQVQNIE
ncbi:MAG: YicC family protein [Butyricicoccus sp.]|nr:YicC family protein [Butyricicoccus sp.]